MNFGKRIQYLRRISAAYLGKGTSQLTFWHEVPAVNPDARFDRLGPYYMTFSHKANYSGPFDEKGVPLLDYRGTLALQYNPIAIAQYGLANYNLMAKGTDEPASDRFYVAATWLRDNLESNDQGLPVWNHHFDWEYRTTLKAPWYSGLAQGQGISLLVRAFAESKDQAYMDAADSAFEAMVADVEKGGTLFTDGRDRKWIEEYIVDPPTHILNGFMWATWGVFDYVLATGDDRAQELLAASLSTLGEVLADYDTGYWSLYEQSGTRMPMLASPFYHDLHIVQLRVLHVLTKDPIFGFYADKWALYRVSRLRRTRALAQKALFKIVHY